MLLKAFKTCQDLQDFLTLSTLWRSYNTLKHLWAINTLSQPKTFGLVMIKQGIYLDMPSLSIKIVWTLATSYTLDFAFIKTLYRYFLCWTLGLWNIMIIKWWSWGGWWEWPSVSSTTPASSAEVILVHLQSEESNFENSNGNSY